MTDHAIRIGLPDTDPPQGASCGCCDGTTLSTLQPIENRPNLSEIRYRAGDHASFKASMLARLASSAAPALLALGTRDDDDLSIALVDAWATVCDVLTFYQERLANEAYIGTATDRFSIAGIARLIGYRLQPGSAAETDLVVLMEDPPGAEPDVASLTVPAGTRVQSQPGPDEDAQVFETLAALDARVAWNRLRPRQDRRVTLAAGATGTWLAGQATGLSKGDHVLVVHPRRADPGAAGYDVASPLWDVRRLTAVSADAVRDRTWIAWEGTLGSVSPAGDTAPVHRLFALRKSAALFGAAAPHPLVLTYATRDAFGFTDETPPANSPSTITGSHADPGDWDFAASIGDAQIPLDSVRDDFVAGGWAVLSRPGGTRELYGIAAADADAAAKFAISGRASLLTPDRSGWAAAFADAYRRVTVLGASAELALADTPDLDPVFGTALELDAAAEDLPAGRLLSLSGRRAQVLVEVASLPVFKAGFVPASYPRHTRLTLAVPPFMFPRVPDLGLWLFTDAKGDISLALAWRSALKPVPASEDAEGLSERITLAGIDAADPQHPILTLAAPLANAYDRASLAIHGNVAAVSHGESVAEILGGGDPTRPFQSFALKQNPVTHRVAATETGTASTLTVRVDGVAWDEVPDLYDRGPTARVFATALDDKGVTTVRFGDGISGARPPAGRDNIQARHRTGLGAAGTLRAGQLTLPIDRPLGLKEVVNPRPATGGADAETTDAARRNAPICTLTLGRVVSVTDYRDFALGYPGIARADARWIWHGESRRIVVTVAGDGGAAVPRTGPLYPALLDAFRRYGDPLASFDLVGYQPVAFRLGLKVAVDRAHDDTAVLAGVEAALRAAYAFDRRDFARNVALSEVAAVAHGVTGVVAVDIDLLYRESGPQSDLADHMLLQSQTGRTGSGGALLGAEILTLSPEPFDRLEVMS